MDVNEMIQKLLAAEIAKLEQPAEPQVAAKAFDVEAFSTALSEKLGEVVEKAVDAKVAEIKAAAEPKQIVAKANDFESDPVAFIAAKSKRGEALNDDEKRIAWAVTQRVLSQGLQ